ncbi:MAG: hypothetical protein LBI38_00345 [Oscillospiraceae bacterium]|jgi:hypothetical protein|nr:hypothetical protein [Oscillospiraceae bacterium]
MSGEMRGGIYSLGAVRLARLSGELVLALLKADGASAKALGKSVLNLGKERKERRRGNLDFEIAAEAAKLWIVANEESRRINAVIEEIQAEKQKRTSAVRAELKDDGDRFAYMKELGKSREKINIFIAEKAEEISRGFIGKMNAEADKFKYKTSVWREELLSEAKKLSGDIAGRDAFVKDAAEKTIAKARMFCADLEKRYGFAERGLLEEHLCSAERLLGSGNREAAIIAAFDAVNEAASLIARTEARLALPEAMYALCVSSLAECRELLTSGRSFEVKNSPITTAEKIGGESEIYDIDLAEFTGDEYGRLTDRVKMFAERLEKPVYAFADGELDDIRSGIDELYREINGMLLKGIELVNNAFLRDYMRECVADALEGCGLREEDAGEEETPNASAQRFVNPNTGEEISVMFASRFDERDALQTEMRVFGEAKDYGTAECGRRLDKYRVRILEKMGSDETLRGEGMEAELRCAEETGNRNRLSVREMS